MFKKQAATAASAVLVSHEPAQLIQIIGEPVFAPVAGTSLLWVSNTESDLFRQKATGAFYYGGYSPAAGWHSPYIGAFGRGAAVYGPSGGAGGFAAYNPRTGTYARGGAVYGPYGSRVFDGTRTLRNLCVLCGECVDGRFSAENAEGRRDFMVELEH